MFLILTFAYLIGSIPFGKLITKFLTNKDITKTGSGNIGATNAVSYTHLTLPTTVDV